MKEGEALLEDSPHYLHKKWVLWFDGALQSGRRSGALAYAAARAHPTSHLHTHPHPPTRPHTNTTTPPLSHTHSHTPGAQDWAKNMKKLCTFDTIEEFWGAVENVPPPSKLPVGCNYHLFREGIMPLWEDGHNIKGGKWTYNEKRDKGMSTPHVDNLWLYAMMTLVGEMYGENSDQICGAVCSLRQKQDRVAVWTKRCVVALVGVCGMPMSRAMSKGLGGSCSAAPPEMSQLLLLS